MSNNQIPIDPKHLEFLKQIPRAAICGFREHDGLEEQLAAERASRAADQQTISALREALAWYADKKTWHCQRKHPRDNPGACIVNAHEDRGERARAFLAPPAGGGDAAP